MIYYEVDIGNPTAVRTAVREVVAHFGAIGIPSNHVGTVVVRAFLDTTEDDWDRLMAIKVMRMFLTCKESCQLC